MLYSRRDILDEFLNTVQEPGDARARVTAGYFLDRAVERIWMKHTWRQFLMPTPFILSTVANRRSYSLPENFGRISTLDGIIRNVTRRSKVVPIDPESAQERDYTIGTSNEVPGCPHSYWIDGSWGVNVQPSTAGEEVEVLSDDPADTAVRAFAEGEDADGNWRSVQVTLTGTAAVSLGTFRLIQSFGKGYPDGVTPPTANSSSAGTVTLRTVTGATALQTLNKFEAAREQQIITLVNIPDAVYDMAIPMLRRPRRMVYDADPIPDGWAAAIIEDMMIAWRVNQGKITLDSGVARPNLVDLVSNDNISRLPLRSEPYGG